MVVTGDTGPAVGSGDIYYISIIYYIYPGYIYNIYPGYICYIYPS